MEKKLLEQKRRKMKKALKPGYSIYVNSEDLGIQFFADRDHLDFFEAFLLSSMKHLPEELETGTAHTAPISKKDSELIGPVFDEYMESLSKLTRKLKVASNDNSMMDKKKVKAIKELRNQLRPDNKIFAHDKDDKVQLIVDRNHLVLLSDFLEEYVKLYGLSYIDVQVMYDKPIRQIKKIKIHIALAIYYETMAVTPLTINGDKAWDKRANQGTP